MKTDKNLCANCGHLKHYHRYYGLGNGRDTSCHMLDYYGKRCPCKKFVPQNQIPSGSLNRSAGGNQSQDASVGNGRGADVSLNKLEPIKAQHPDNIQSPQTNQRNNISLTAKGGDTQNKPADNIQKKEDVRK
jgi:hypothetical protein